MPEELRGRLTDASSATGRSLNKEIVERLEESLEPRAHRGPVDPHRDPRGAAGRPSCSPSPPRCSPRRSRGSSRASARIALSAQLQIAAEAAGEGARTAARREAPPPAAVAVSRPSLLGARAAVGRHAHRARHRRARAPTRPPSRACRPSASPAGSWNELTARPVRRRRSRLPRLLLELERRRRPRHRPHHRARDRRGRRTSTPAGANGGVWRSTTGGGNWKPIADGCLAVLGRPAARRARRPLVRHRRGEHRRHALRRQPASTGSPIRSTGTFSADRPGRRQRAREHHDPPAALRRRHRSGPRRARRLDRTRVDAACAGRLEAAFAPNPGLPARRRDTAGATRTRAYKNIVNDVAVDPKNAKHVIARSAGAAATPTTASTSRPTAARPG